MAKASKTKLRESAAICVYIKESVRILEALPDGPNGEKIYNVVLITEGLGNMRQKNYYGPEAVESASKVYEGKRCYINHQSTYEEETLPERNVRDLAGYYKNLKVEIIEGKKACVGEVHCDLSESGRFLAEKIQSALQYQKDFPARTQEYCGFSVNGDGEAEARDIDTAAGSLSVYYVKSFTEESESCDLVTSPARGGKAVSVIKESQDKTKENVMKNVIKALKTAFSKVSESAKKATGEDKKPLLEASKTLTEAIKLAEAGGEEMAESEAIPAFLAKKEGEAEGDHVARMQAIKKMVDEMLAGEQSEQSDTQEAQPGAELPKPAPAACESRRPLSADDLERNMLAVKSIMRESNLPEDCYPDTKITKLAKMPFKEAKAIIEGDAQLAASILRESGVDPVASLRHTAKTKESAGGCKAAFMESFKQEEN